MRPGLPLHGSMARHMTGHEAWIAVTRQYGKAYDRAS